MNQDLKNKINNTENEIKNKLVNINNELTNIDTLLNDEKAQLYNKNNVNNLKTRYNTIYDYINSNNIFIDLTQKFNAFNVKKNDSINLYNDIITEKNNINQYITNVEKGGGGMNALIKDFENQFNNIKNNFNDLKNNNKNNEFMTQLINNLGLDVKIQNIENKITNANNKNEDEKYKDYQSLLNNDIKNLKQDYQNIITNNNCNNKKLEIDGYINTIKADNTIITNSNNQPLIQEYNRLNYFTTFQQLVNQYNALKDKKDDYDDANLNSLNDIAQNMLQLNNNIIKLKNNYKVDKGTKKTITVEGSNKFYDIDPNNFYNLNNMNDQEIVVDTRQKVYDIKDNEMFKTSGDKQQDILKFYNKVSNRNLSNFADSNTRKTYRIIPVKLLLMDIDNEELNKNPKAFDEGRKKTELGKNEESLYKVIGGQEKKEDIINEFKQFPYHNQIMDEIQNSESKSVEAYNKILDKYGYPY